MNLQVTYSLLYKTEPTSELDRRFKWYTVYSLFLILNIYYINLSWMLSGIHIINILHWVNLYIWSYMYMILKACCISAHFEFIMSLLLGLPNTIPEQRAQPLHRNWRRLSLHVNTDSVSATTQIWAIKPSSLLRQIPHSYGIVLNYLQCNATASRFFCFSEHEGP